MYNPVQNQQSNQQQGQIKIIGNYSYNLRYCLGEGAYGKVYEGVETKTQKKIAIKKMDIKSFERDTYLRNQIVSEIEILKKFNHRNIVQFIDLITTQRSLYIITEYCANGDLRQLMQNRRLAEDQSIKIFRHILEGFKELIKHNVIHRDLKPANILVHDGVFKIADFGFAKYVDYSSAQLLKSCVGSPLYMAPQLLKRQQYGTKCDIWSLGVIFHEMIFHDVPWKARDERELLHNIMTQPYKLKPGIKVSKFTESVLKKCLVIDEDKRITWDALFDMFKQQEYDNKMPMYNINNGQQNKENNFNNNNKNQPKVPQSQNNSFSDLNKPKKSIFNTNISNKDPLSQVDNKNIKQKIPPMSKAERDKLEMMKLLNYLYGLRSEVVYKHFVCVDLFTKLNFNKSFIKDELIYEKFLLVLASSVKQQQFILMKQVRDIDQRSQNQECYKNSKEVQQLSNSIKKENEYYSYFMDEMCHSFKMTNILDQLRSENDIQFVFQEIYSDNDAQQLDAKILNIGKEICKEVLANVKQRKLEESLRSVIISQDNILDVILTKKKLQKGQDVNFNQLYKEKSEQHDLKNYFDKTINKMQPLISTGFNFF